ncbi:MAG: FtsW/RodA/SpoVE family cell cycle protein, partial [Actinomycetota bacterium]
LGAIGAGSVAAARADGLDLAPLPGVAAVTGLFLAMHLVLRRWAPLSDPYVLPVVAALSAVGLVELDRIDPSLARDQVIWVAAGAAVFIATIVLLRDHRVLERYRYLVGLGGVLLLLITMVFGTTINGSKLWIEVGGGQTVQPGELAKVMIVVFMAGYLRDKREVLAIPTTRRLGMRLPAMRHLAPVLVVWGAALVAVVVLNDFGTALLFYGAFLAMIYLATARASYAAVGMALFVAGSVLVWAVVPRIGDRVDAWLDPFADAQGRGFQLVQSLYALADGGIVGPGFGKGFLVRDDGSTVVPELQTDFIFTAVGSELGYIGAVGVLVLFLLLVQRGFRIAIGATDGFSKLLAGGLTTVLALQAFLIVAGVIRLVPLTGVTLPFMSYGGSSTVVNFGLAALLLVISHRSRAHTLAAARAAEDGDA